MLVYVLSGVMSAIAGIVMLARFNSVRVGHGEACTLVTVLACFLGWVDPFGGFGRTVSVLLALVILQVIASGLNAARRQPAPRDGTLGPVSDPCHDRTLELAGPRGAGAAE